MCIHIYIYVYVYTYLYTLCARIYETSSIRVTTPPPPQSDLPGLALSEVMQLHYQVQQHESKKHQNQVSGTKNTQKESKHRNKKNSGRVPELLEQLSKE